MGERERKEKKENNDLSGREEIIYLSANGIIARTRCSMKKIEDIKQIIMFETQT